MPCAICSCPWTACWCCSRPQQRPSRRRPRPDRRGAAGDFPELYAWRRGGTGEGPTPAAEIVDLMVAHGGGNRRLAVDRVNPEGAAARELGLSLHNGEAVMELARVIKGAPEAAMLRPGRLRGGDGRDAGRAGAGHHRDRTLVPLTRRQYQTRRRVDRDAFADLGRAHQPLASGMRQPRNPGRRFGRLRHRFDRPLWLCRYLAHLAMVEPASDQQRDLLPSPASISPKTRPCSNPACICAN